MSLNMMHRYYKDKLMINAYLQHFLFHIIENIKVLSPISKEES